MPKPVCSSRVSEEARFATKLAPFTSLNNTPSLSQVFISKHEHIYQIVLAENYIFNHVEKILKQEKTTAIHTSIRNDIKQPPMPFCPKHSMGPKVLPRRTSKPSDSSPTHAKITITIGSGGASSRSAKAMINSNFIVGALNLFSPDGKSRKLKLISVIMMLIQHDSIQRHLTFLCFIFEKAKMYT